LDNKNTKDIFGFADAINLDHLNLEQLKELEKILDKIKQMLRLTKCNFWTAPLGRVAL
jgi:hypothetical protein